MEVTVDREANAIERKFLLCFPGDGDIPVLCRATWGSTRFVQEAEGAWGKPEPLLRFPQEKEGRSG